MRGGRFGLLLALIGAMPFSVFPQENDFTGTWQARLRFLRFDIRIVCTLKKDTGGGWSGTAQSPDQSKLASPMEEILVEEDSIAWEISEWDASFQGAYVADSNAIIGRLLQRGFKVPVKFIKGEEDDLLYDRPQRPRPPYPYRSEEIRVVNTIDKDTLAGTLTMPSGKGPFPAAILITGSGAQDRDESIFGHKPFLLMADRLTRAGFAVLRCDDRGAGKSTGDASTSDIQSIRRDVEAQLRYLRKRKEINRKKIGLIGHSEGGIVAPLVAADNPNVAFMVLLAAPTIDFFDLLLAQDSISQKAEGVSRKKIDQLVKTNTKLFEIVKTTTDSLETQRRIVEYLESEKASDAEMELAIRQLCSPMMRAYVGFDPAVHIRRAGCPLLALYGELDVQVPPAVNTTVLEPLLNDPRKKGSEIRVLEGLNHLLQPCKKGAVSEYVDIPVTMSPEALSLLESWLRQQVAH